MHKKQSWPWSYARHWSNSPHAFLGNKVGLGGPAVSMKPGLGYDASRVVVGRHSRRHRWTVTMASARTWESAGSQSGLYNCPLPLGNASHAFPFTPPLLVLFLLFISLCLFLLFILKMIFAPRQPFESCFYIVSSPVKPQLLHLFFFLEEGWQDAHQTKSLLPFLIAGAMALPVLNPSTSSLEPPEGV